MAPSTPQPPPTPEVAPTAIGPGDSVRAIIARFPGTVPVFERHGLLGCGGTGGPEERIDVFAIAHRIKVKDLVSELNAAAARPAEAQEAAGPDETATLYRRFVLASLVSTLTLGATFGAWNLLASHLTLARVPDPSAAIHGGFQVWGFVFLFTVGVAYHALPRFLGARLQPLLPAKATLPLLVGGILLRAAGQTFAMPPALLAGGLLLAAGTLVFGRVLARTRAASTGEREAFQRWLAAGFLWWLAAALLLVAGAIAGVVSASAAVASRFNEPAYAAALFGGAFHFIGGMLQRIGGVFLGLPELPPARSRRFLLAFQAPVLLLVAGGVLSGPLASPHGAHLFLAGLAGFAILTVPFALRLGVFAARGGHGGADPALGRAVRVAFASLLAFCALSLLHAGIALATGWNALVWDAARHAYTLGFVALMVFAIAGRILPIFSGQPLALARLRDLATGLVAVGVVLRLLEVPATLGAPGLLAGSAVSGLVALLGVTVFAVGLLATLRAEAGNDVRTTGPAPLAITTKVAALIESYPPALAILIENGFTPLANPISRRTLAKMVSLEEACQMNGKDAKAILEQIRTATLSHPSGGTP